VWGNCSADAISQLTSTQKRATRIQHFWNRWRREYLADLREFHRGKRENNKRVVEKGDVVIVYEDDVKKGKWKIMPKLDYLFHIHTR
jgi:exonuclease III